MPELPEVETIKNDLRPQVTGRVILGARVFWAGVIQEPFWEELIVRLAGQGIEQLSRQGKYLLFHLSSGQILVFHLGMTGRLLLRRAADPEDPYTRASFLLEGGLELRFADMRKFGRIWLVEDAAAVVRKLGPDPLDGAFSEEALASRLQRRPGRIKAVLLDQSFLAGLGNIYADEALFQARIHPLRQARSLSPAEVAGLHRAIGQVLWRSIRNRGTSFSDYRDGFGQEGRNQEALSIYRRAGEACPCCGALIQRIVVAGRGTHLCPHCQVGPTQRSAPTR